MDKLRTSQQLEQLLNLYMDQQNDPCLSKMLEKSLISKMQDENSARIIVAYSNKLLNVSLNRSKGLKILDKIIPYCPISVLTDIAINWTNICINYSSKEPINLLRFTVLVKLIQTCSGTPDYNKSVMQSMSKIIDMCLSINPNEFLSKGSLECLKVCMQTYPSTCSPFRIKIEAYLTKYLTCLMPSVIVKKAGSAFHYLQQVGGSGPDGITHKNNWSDRLTKLCSTMHKLYNQFFVRVTEFENKDMDAEPFEFPQLSADNSSVPHLTANALQNIVIFINCMLVESFPVEKGISILHILDVIKRGLLVDTFTDFDNSIEETQFASLLYSHQIDLLYLLRSLIACFKQNMIPFSFTITKLLTDCLQRTQKNYFRSSSEYQKAVYKVLKYWIIIAESKLNNNMHNKLVTLIVSEITPAKTNVMLCLNETLAKKKGKGKKKTVQEPVKIDENITESQNFIVIKEATCIEALKTGKTLLEHVMLQLDQDTYKILFQTIIQHLLNIQGGKTINPYANPKCQAYLYEMLACILLQPKFCMSPLLQIAINIFTRGQNRSVNFNNDHIFLACAKGLNILEKLCQATCPTLNINNFKTEDDMKQNTSRKRIYEMNDIEGDFSSFTSNDMVINHENEIIQTVDEAVQIFSPPKDYSNSPKRIHVLDNQIVKPGCNGTNGNHPDDTIDTDVMQVDIPEEEQQENLIAQIEDVSVKVLYETNSSENNFDEQPEQFCFLQNLDELKTEIKDECKSLNSSMVYVNCIEKVDHDLEDDEGDMLNSFQDVLSQ